MLGLILGLQRIAVSQLIALINRKFFEYLRIFHQERYSVFLRALSSYRVSFDRWARVVCAHFALFRSSRIFLRHELLLMEN